MKRILTIGGSDPFAGGGIQTDLKTFENFGLFGLSALTSIGALDINERFMLESISLELLKRQLVSIDKMTSLDGIKIWLLNSSEAIMVVRDFIKTKQNIPIILDPVLAFKETEAVINQLYISQLIEELFPLVTMITPNLAEAALLSGQALPSSLTEMIHLAKELTASGTKNIVIKGGTRMAGDEAVDLLYSIDHYEVFSHKKIDTTTVNGAGCAFSSAITANLVLGADFTKAVAESKKFVAHCISNGVLMNDHTGSVWSGGIQKGGMRNEN
ncbi:TPA: hydroxymethylpyrimidine/phosphomethylpyrimidine kinase [Enterococcus faecium]|nr:hydroxymethylpyrimidine/phosphomethylpyrimidine kinase [Enterococcus faecium]